MPTFDNPPAPPIQSSTPHSTPHSAHSIQQSPPSPPSPPVRAADNIANLATIEASIAAVPSPFVVRPWIDPVIEGSGHDPHSRYVELFWLSVLGPTATWLIRRFADGLQIYPDGFELDLHETARAIGLSTSPGKSAPFVRALSRCVLFNMAFRNEEGFDVRRKVPSLEQRHIKRLPEHLQAAHREWHHEHRTERPDVIELQRAEAVAEALLRTGDDPATVERRLLLLGTPPRTIEFALRSVGSRR